jgi:hypothetical protein
MNLSVYKTRCGRKYNTSDIAKFMRQFQLNEALRLIGEISSSILMDDNPEPIRMIDSVPISDSILAYLSMTAIENSNDYRSKIMTIGDLATAADMYFGLPEPLVSGGSLNSFLVRFGTAQFDYDREINNIVPRTFLLYCQLWHQTPEAKSVDIEQLLVKLTGLKIEEILALGFAYFGASSKGFFRLYRENQIPSTDKQFFTLEKQRIFSNWISSTYQNFRIESSGFINALPDPSYEKNRFNLLTKYPVIVPDRNPDPQLDKPYIVPIKRLLIERITRGIYFDLSDLFKENGRRNNIFRVAFGHVFQAYVGLIIKKAQKKITLLPEWKYGRPEKRTPDWIIVEGNKAVLIEVKQSGLFLPAKTTGESDVIKKSLIKTFSEAVKQLITFEGDLTSSKYDELTQLSRITAVERLLITYDRTYFSNSVLKQCAFEVAIDKGVQIPEDFHLHVCSVEEFEYILALDFASLFDFLREKKLDSEKKDWDFREYCASKFNWQGVTNQFLTKVRTEFIEHVENSLKT